MNKWGWSTRAALRYAAFQVPGVLLLVLFLILVKRWVDIPAWIAWGLVGLWVVKDIALFPFVWRAYDPDSAWAVNSMLGARGVAKDRLAPSGYVRVHGELWQAEVIGDGPAVDSGQRVRVRGISGLVLLVHSDDARTD